jgi:hypothetical protein
MNYRILLIGLFCLISLTLPCFANEWRNIFPLKTTHAEVINLLGEPQRSNEEEGEYFQVEDGAVKMGWQRADCYSKEDVSSDQSAKPENLVNQITFLPKEPVSLASIDSEKSSKEKKASEVPHETKTKVKKAFEKWMSQDVSCLIGSGEAACNVMGDGFGYYLSKGITALYYYPTQKEFADWKEKLKPCAVEEK